MKICVVLPSHPSAGFGGAEYQVSLLIDRLLEKMPSAQIVYLARCVDPQLRESRYAVKQLRSALGIRRLGFFTDACSLYKHLQRADPDVVYQRVGCAYTGVCAFYARRYRKNMIWHISIDGDLSNHTDRFPLVTRGIERAIRDFGIRRSTCIVAQTDYQARLLKESYGATAEVIRNFHPQPTMPVAKTEAPTVVWIANMKPAKRPELFVEVADRLRDIPQIRFLVAGKNGDRPPYSQMLGEATATLPLHYVGALTLAEANDFIGSAWVLVNTSSVEGFPNTFIQAWQRRTVVASLSVNPDRVLDTYGITGDCDDPGVLAQRIRSLIVSTADRNRMVAAAERYAIESHGMRNADRLIDLLRAN